MHKQHETRNIIVNGGYDGNHIDDDYDDDNADNDGDDGDERALIANVYMCANLTLIQKLFYDIPLSVSL